MTAAITVFPLLGWEMETLTALIKVMNLCLVSEIKSCSRFPLLN